MKTENDPLREAVVDGNHVCLVSDDGPADEETDRLHILAADDYYLSIGPGTRLPFGQSFRARTSGARNPFVTAVVAALYKRTRGDVHGATECLRVAIRGMCEEPDIKPAQPAPEPPSAVEEPRTEPVCTCGDWKNERPCPLCHPASHAVYEAKHATPEAEPPPEEPRGILERIDHVAREHHDWTRVQTAMRSVVEPPDVPRESFAFDGPAPGMRTTITVEPPRATWSSSGAEFREPGWKAPTEPPDVPEPTDESQPPPGYRWSWETQRTHVTRINDKATNPSAIPLAYAWDAVRPVLATLRGELEETRRERDEARHIVVTHGKELSVALCDADDQRRELELANAARKEAERRATVLAAARDEMRARNEAAETAMAEAERNHAELRKTVADEMATLRARVFEAERRAGREEAMCNQFRYEAAAWEELNADAMKAARAQQARADTAERQRDEALAKLAIERKNAEALADGYAKATGMRFVDDEVVRLREALEREKADGDEMREAGLALAVRARRMASRGSLYRDIADDLGTTERLVKAWCTAAPTQTTDPSNTGGGR